MKSIATITFHASYNYGSNLQAYALQEYIKKLLNNECNYKIINLRKKEQKEMYKNIFEKKGLKNYLRRIAYHRYKKSLLLKSKYFEDFIQNKLSLTEEYKSLEEIKMGSLDFDYFISGSDQLWNKNTSDYDWAYLLEFIKGKNKISYAASFGDNDQIWNNEEKRRIASDLNEYKYISVRESKSADNVFELTGIKPVINIDPSLLISYEEWNSIISKDRIVDGNYIFLYNLKFNDDCLLIASKLSKILKLPIVISRMGSRKEFKYRFKRVLAVGPLEFLNLVKNSKLVLSSSYHGTLFAALFHKPFWSINGMDDYRIKSFLTKFGFEDRNISMKDDIYEKSQNTFNMCFEHFEDVLIEERNKSKEYLCNALNIK